MAGALSPLSAQETEPVVSVRGLVKCFGRVRALDGLDLEVRRGEVHGFVGPNGAGKTTTLRILLGLLRADEGAVTLLGGDPWLEAVELHRRVAYVPGEVSLWPRLTGGETIDLLLRLRGGVDEARRAELIKRFELDPSKRARAYSKGNRQKVALVAALASGADLLVLDEPTSGLDPVMEAVFQQSVREAVADGRTVLLSSHLLSEVEALCDRVSIVRSGRTVRVGSLAELRQVSLTSVDAVVAGPVDALHALPGVHGLHVEGNRVRFDVDQDCLGDAVAVLARAGVRSLTSRPPTLEEVFLRNYEGELREDLLGESAQGRP